MLEQLVSGNAEELSQKMIELAKQGNVRCLEFLVERLLPKPGGRPLDLQLPSINSVRDVMAAMATITTAVNNGDVTAEQTANLIRYFEGYANIVTTHDLVVRVEALELVAKERGNDDDLEN
jgi:hypothetical protein